MNARTSKKGVSPLVSWVLIITMTIGLGAIITSWYLNRTEDTTSQTMATLEGGIECSEVNINVAYTKDPAEKCIVKVANTGNLKIDYVKLDSNQYVFGRNHGDYKNFTGCRADKITVTPMLKKGNNLVACKNDRIYEQKIL